MTEWEKKWMSKTLPDCLRTFRLNPNAPGGWSEYGETMLDLQTTESLTDDNGQMNLSLIKVDAVAPLPYGTFIRMFLFGDITDGVPVWEFEDNGEPKNFRNFFITDANSRWFEYHPTGHINRYRHDYNCEEVIACLKDYPIRSVKTFAEGAYTFRQCLDIAFKLAFRPRSLGNYTYVIKDFPGLDEPNSKLEYPNSTLYDVVTDIGRIIDAVPSMEITFADGVYTFELRFLDRYGLEGKVFDISYFNMKRNDAVNLERYSSAGTCITNAQNLIVGNASKYPNENGIMPDDTNLSDSWEYFELPYAIESAEEVDIYWEYNIKKYTGTVVENAAIYDVRLYDGQEFKSQILLAGALENILFRNPIVVTQEGSNDPYLYAKNQIKQTKLYLCEYEEYKLLPSSGDISVKTQQNTIYYRQGDNKIYLSALFNVRRFWYLSRLYTDENNQPYENSFATFSPQPNNVPSHNNKNSNKFYVAVKFRARLNGCIKGINSKLSDYTAFFNQQGQVVDIKSFGTAVTNYTKSMYGESRVVCHTYDRIGRREMYEQMPKVGDSVIDKKRGKRYVATQISFTRRKNGGLLIATLGESRAGKSHFIIADNQQRCYAIPSENVVDSMSHTHILCKMGVQSPFSGESNTGVIEKPYLFNAFIGTTHGAETQPQKVSLQIATIEEVKSVLNDIVFSRMRLSAILSFRMLTNSVAKIVNGKAQLYTDTNGQLSSIDFQYMAGNNRAVGFSQTLDKDSYEILNHTTQVSWVEYGNLRIHESLIDMSYFGNGDGLNEPLQLVLLSSRMRLNDPLSGHVAARYDVSYADSGIEHIFTASGMNSIPDHVGWAIARGDKVILLDNFDQITDNVVKVYYQVELRD